MHNDSIPVAGVAGKSDRATRQGLPGRKAGWLSVHRWIGLSVGLLLLIQGLSGTSLVFRQWLEPIVHGALQIEQGTERVPVQALLDTARQASPGYKIDRVDFPESPERAVVLKMSAIDGGDKRLLAIDPYQGDVVRAGGLAAWPFEFMLLLHEEFLVGPAGEWIIGIEGIALLFMAITGLVTWWPAGRRFASGFKVARGKSAEIFWRTLHRAVGAGISLVLIFSALTGALMAFKDPLRSALKLTGEVVDKPSAKTAECPGQALIPIDTIIADSQRNHGTTALRQLRFPDAQGRGVSVYLASPDSARPLATKIVAYDVHTGRELGNYVPERLPLGNDIVDWLYPLHNGAVLGGLMRFVVFFGGLGLVGLGASGLWLWVKARRRKQARPQ